MSDISPTVSSSSASPLSAPSLPPPRRLYVSVPSSLSSPLLSTPLLVPTVAWQVTGDANNSGCGSPCSAKHKPHDKLPSSVCFANRPRRSPPRPVVTFCCILYMQIPANQLARHPPSPPPPCPLWLKWIDCGLKSTPASLPTAEGSTGRYGRKWGGKDGSVVSPLFPSLCSLLPLHNCGA